VKRILVLGASGQIARWVVRDQATKPATALTLLLRDPTKLAGLETGAAKLVIGSVLDKKLLRQAMAGQDIVYANLTGDDLGKQAEHIIAAMRAEGVRRLIFVASLGIYDEVPDKFGAWNRREIGAYLGPYRKAADLIEAAGLDYTILRPAWLQDDDEVNFEVTERQEPFKGTEVSRRSVAALVSQIIEKPDSWAGRNVGINKPGTDGDKPRFA